MHVDSEHSTESTVSINPFIYSTHLYWMGPALESEIISGKERALVSTALELKLMVCLVAWMTCEQIQHPDGCTFTHWMPYILNND